MNLLDLGILILLGLVTVRGYFRGLFQEVAVLVGVAGGVLAAAHTYQRLAELLASWITEPQWAQIIAFVVVLVAIYWLTRLVAHSLQRLFFHLYLDFLERLLGGAFALAKGALLIGFALMLIFNLAPQAQKSRVFQESRTAPKLSYLAQQSLELLPSDFKNQIPGYIQQLRKWWKRDTQKQAQGLQDEGTQGLADFNRTLQNLRR